MTREEAIKILEEEAEFLYGGDEPYNKIAFDMAIEALSAPSGDLISRADAMTEFREWVKRANENGETPTWNDAVSLIGSLPSAKLNNPCNSLLTDESNGSKEHKSKLDLISRADAIKAIRKCKFESDMPSYWYRGMEDAQDIIENIPSADAGSREVKGDDKFNTCNNNNNNADADYKSHLIDLLKARKQFFVDAYGGSFHCMSEKDKARCDEIDACIASIVNAPTDAVEIVRCKDCKYSFYDKDYESYNCRKHEYVELFDADDYCSWGERND